MDGLNFIKLKADLILRWTAYKIAKMIILNGYYNSAAASKEMDFKYFPYSLIYQNDS